jgi:putative aldouronate transport system permease protein
LGTGFAIMVAIFLADLRNRHFTKTIQSLIILPALVSWVVASTIVYSLLSTESGIINKLIGTVNISPISWYNTPNAWPIIIFLVYIWKNAGFQCVIFMASILSFNPEIYEAARIDGANKWKQIRFLTVPMLKPTIIMIVLLSLGRIFYSDFGLFYQVPMNIGALFSTTSTIDTYVFNGLVKLGNLGMTSAAGFYQSIVGFVLILVSNLIVRKISPENALF